MWFLGASSTCELRHLQPENILKRLPSIKALDLTLIGFLGDKDPDNSVVPDARAKNLPEGVIRTEVADKRDVSLRAFKGTLQEALDRNFASPESGAADKEGGAKQGGGGYNASSSSSAAA